MSKLKAIHLLIVAGSLAVSSAAYATEYYVCYNATECNSGAGSNWSSGSSGNSGLSKSSPWQCPDDVEGNLSAGDVVIFGDGNYTFSRCGSGNEILNLNGTKGTSSDWIVLRAENKWGAVFDGQDTASSSDNRSRYLVKVSGASYIRFEDFEMKSAQVIFHGNDQSRIAHHLHFKGMRLHDCGLACIHSGVGVNHDWIIEANYIYDIVDRASDPCNHNHGAYLHGYNHTLVNNVLYSGFGGSLLSVGGICSLNGQNDPPDFTHTIWAINNTFDGNGCVLSTSARDSIDFYNRQFANADNCANKSPSGTPRNFKNVRFDNNLFLHGETQNDSSGRGAQFVSSDSTTNESVSCTHWPWYQPGCSTQARGTAGYLEFNNNVSETRAQNSQYQGFTTVYSQNCDSCTSINLTNETGHDYEPTVDSSAIIGTGSPTYAPIDDILGNPRDPGSVDVGAYQISTSGPRPNPPVFSGN